MKTTITESEGRFIRCHKCGGEGRIPYYGHVKGGECFACGGTGGHVETVEMVREMTDEEVTAALTAAGFIVMPFDEQPEGEWGIFWSEEQAERYRHYTLGARMMLAAI